MSCRRNPELVIAEALALLEKRAKCGDVLTNPGTMRDWLRLRLGQSEREEFACIFLSAQHRVIEFDVLFQGTLTQTSVFPREVVKAAPKHNVAAVIFAHNYPSGVSEPNQADQTITETLKRALALVDAKVLDHIVLGGVVAMSFAERGLL